MSNVIDLDKLSPQEINEVHRTMVLELEAVQNNQQALRVAFQKYQQSYKSVDSLKRSAESTTKSLIPLTTSMYIIGEIREVQKVMVDIGTGFFVEKTIAEALTFFQKKLDLITNNLDKIETILASKRNDLAKVRSSMQMRVNMMQQRQGAGQKA